MFTVKHKSINSAIKWLFQLFANSSVLQTVRNQIRPDKTWGMRPDKTSGVMGIQTDRIPERIFRNLKKKSQQTTKKHEKYPVGKELTLKAPTSFIIFERNKEWYFMRIV